VRPAGSPVPPTFFPALAATARVAELARPADDRGYYEGLLGRYSLVRRFMPALLRTIQFQGTSAGRYSGLIP